MFIGVLSAYRLLILIGILVHAFCIWDASGRPAKRFWEIAGVVIAGILVVKLIISLEMRP